MIFAKSFKNLHSITLDLNDESFNDNGAYFRFTFHYFRFELDFVARL